MGGTLKFSHITNPQFNKNGNDQFLTVNEQGEVTLSKYRLQVQHPNEWADRVFTNGYKLAPLQEVEAFINAHGHLPGVPSAAEVVEQGIDATRFNAKMLEKIEEMTLYMIEFRKENDALKASVNQLKRENQSLHKKINRAQPKKR